MISVRGDDVPAWTQPMAIFVGDIIPVNQLNPFSVRCEKYALSYMTLRIPSVQWEQTANFPIGDLTQTAPPTSVRAALAGGGD